MYSAIYAGEKIWISGYDMFNEDIHRWLDQTPVASGYTNWRGANPQNGDEKYMRIRNDLDGKWGDWMGDGERKYICESGLI